MSHRESIHTPPAPGRASGHRRRRARHLGLWGARDTPGHPREGRGSATRGVKNPAMATLRSHGQGQGGQATSDAGRPDMNSASPREKS